MVNYVPIWPFSTVVPLTLTKRVRPLSVAPMSGATKELEGRERKAREERNKEKHYKTSGG